MPKRKAKKEPYVPSEQEAAAIKSYASRQPTPRLKVHEGRFVPEHPDPAIGDLILMEAIGTKDEDFYQGILRQLANVSSRGEGPDQRDMNFLLSVIKNIRPGDHVESMLATQMAAVHAAMMEAAHRLNTTTELPRADHDERLFNRLARTFTSQMVTLIHYRERKAAMQQASVNQARAQGMERFLEGMLRDTAKRSHKPLSGPSVKRKGEGPVLNS